MIKATIHTILALSVLLSSAGVWINNHYCSDRLVKTSFLPDTGNCCASHDSAPCMAEQSCANANHEEEGKDDCCHNEPSYHKLEQNLKIQEFGAESLDIDGVSPHINARLLLLPMYTTLNAEYIPPVIVYDRGLRFQTFLC